MNSLPSLLSTKEAGALLNLSHDTVKRLFERGQLRGYRNTPRGRIRLYRDSVEEYDRQRKSQIPPLSKE